MVKKEAIRAFKAVNIREDGKYECRGYVFEIGKTYKHTGPLVPCESGFHCCPKGPDVYQYYNRGPQTEVLEVEVPASAKVVEHGDKLCVDRIKIIGPVPDRGFNTGYGNTGYGNTGSGNTGNRNPGYWNTGSGNTGNRNTGDSNTGDRNTGDSNTGYRNTGDSNTGYRNTGDRNTGDSNTGNWNTGDSNTGYRNTGDSNTGNWNTGDSNTGYSNTGYRNTGDRNTGDSNTGDSNTGDSNTGDSNTGDWNTGNRNTGNRNTGYWNTGDWNTCNFSTGFFNTEEAPVRLFNGAVTMPRSEVLTHPAYQALTSERVYTTKWVPRDELSEEQRKRIGEHSLGLTVPIDWHEAHQDWWERLGPENRKLAQTLPGFCPKIFEKITGIDVKKAVK